MGRHYVTRIIIAALPCMNQDQSSEPAQYACRIEPNGVRLNPHSQCNRGLVTAFNHMRDLR